ncbi:MAG: hypothetical protein QG641_360, partial [Candidatus Poribacteria bacterium]|nr:hypothetical protein [Candidatus Poribacteria bacterium]
NTITNNGGNPIHYEYYDDYKTETHPKDWDYNKKSELLILKNKDQKDQFQIGENKIDVKTKSMPDSSQSYMYQDLPDISTFIYQKSDRFIVDMDDITSGHPFKGIRSHQPHTGAHINFNNKYNRFPKEGSKPEKYPPIYAPVDGIATGIDKSFGQNTGNDRYGVAIAFAKDIKGSIYLFCYGIEPMIPEPSEDFYSKFIMVEQWQRVHKGDIIAYMYTPPGVEGHIHFHIQRSNQNDFMAPAIFTQEVADQFHSKWKEFGIDNGTAMPSCMGYMLGANENPFGTGAVDKL